MPPPIKKMSAECRCCGRSFVSAYRTRKFFYCSVRCEHTMERKRNVKRSHQKRIRRYMEKVAAKAAFEMEVV